MEHLPSPHRVIETEWTNDEIQEALKKSRAALLNNLSSISTSPYDLFLNLPNLENLFLVDTTEFQVDRNMYYVLYGRERGGWEWGSRDIMLDFRHDVTSSQQMPILTATANFTGHVLLYKLQLSEEEERALVEALSLAADRHAGPSSLLISASKFRDVHGLLSALKRNKRLKHLSLQWMDMSHECVEVLSDFTSLTSLHLYNVIVYSEEEFVGKLADLHPSHSPLAASLHRLHIYSKGMDWRKCTGFLHHWQNLKELSLESSGNGETDLQEFMEHLAKKEVGTDARPPQLYSLKLGLLLSVEFSKATIHAMMDALSRSGLPFFEYYHSPDPNDYKDHAAVKAQLWRNQRNFFLGSDLKRVPATSTRLFICGDPFAGKKRRRKTQNTSRLSNF